MEVLEGLSKGQNLIIETQNSEARALVAQSQAISIPWQQQTVTSHAESCDHPVYTMIMKILHTCID